MGVFDNILKKATKIVSDTIESNILEDVKKSVKDNLNINSNTTINNFQNYVIPEKYSNFPKYEGTIVEKPFERETNKYCRITIRYAGTPRNDFISTLMQNGFTKGSSVRYDRENTYVIVDDLGNKTEIVYHIKK